MDAYGITPFDLADYQGNSKICEIILAKNGNKFQYKPVEYKTHKLSTKVLNSLKEIRKQIELSKFGKCNGLSKKSNEGFVCTWTLLDPTDFNGYEDWTCLRNKVVFMSE